MIDTDEYERTTPELEEFEGENLGDLITNLLAEVKRLRKDIEGYKAIWDWLDPKGYAWDEKEFVTLIKEHGFETGDEEE